VKRFVVMEGVEYIGYMAPLHTETVLGLPASLQEVDPQGTFLGSEYLTKINVAMDGEVYQSLDGVLFDEQSIYSPHVSLTKYPAARAGTSYTVPLGVTRIGRFAFDSPKYLQEITLSKYVTEIDRDAFWYMKDATVIVMNPDATFDYDAFEYCSDITIKGYIGSTAQAYAQKMGFNFISIGENLGKLATPTNLGWDGTFATWDPVENAARYDLKFYRWDANNERWDHVSDHDVSVTDGSNRFDYDELLWYQDQRYYFTVTASCTQYESSDPAASPERVGRYSQGTYDPEIADDVLRIPYEPEAGYDYLEMRLMIYDETDNCVVSSWISGNTWNLRGILESYPYGRYRVETELYVSHKGWSLDVATQAAPVYYDYQPVPAINELSIVIPLPQEGLPWAKAEGVKVWAYADSVPYAAAERTDSEYNDCYVYQKEGSYVWNDFEPQGTVSLDKARYGYYLQVYTRPGFEFVDEIQVKVNGSEEDVEIIGHNSATVILRYDFGGPMPSFGSEPEVLPEATVGESYSTVITYTGDYTISGMVGGEWDHFVPGFHYNVREGEMEFSGVAEKAGTYTFEMVAIQGHLSVTKTFTIKVNPGSIAKATVTGITDKTYTGAALKQSPKVVLDGKTLKAGTDYSLSYKNNTDAGTATLIIKGKGAYAGSIEKNFTIKPAALTKVTVKTASYTYDGKAKKPALTVQADKLTVAADGYTAAYAKNINAGTATVTVTGKGNFTGKVKATFTIVPAKVKVPTAKTGLTYTGASQT
ncbi:MAG: leucine-rich repeat protein, partial [Firmicutes bacterium]|nr:leucine-rich repeat protein [Bacillota bacterium]